jgi:hypothetical protein
MLAAGVPVVDEDVEQGFHVRAQHDSPGGQRGERSSEGWPAKAAWMAAEQVGQRQAVGELLDLRLVDRPEKLMAGKGGAPVGNARYDLAAVAFPDDAQALERE